MLNIKDLSRALKQVAEEKGLEAEKVLEAIESSIAAAYKKEYGERGEIVKAKVDLKTGELKFSRVKTVVDETTVRFVEETSEEEKGKSEFSDTDEVKLPRYNPERHILLAEAGEIDPKVQLGDEMTFPLETHEDFGRIAAQTAKQ